MRSSFVLLALITSSALAAPVVPRRKAVHRSSPGFMHNLSTVARVASIGYQTGSLYNHLHGPSRGEKRELTYTE
ncbi:hypothetical protein F5148DRAFT_1213265 [Russula earlei]|uniref:Uncharacterized protein n=1 Tax=Russula earlei TaxID=71964 RepID=A0ACC0U5T6_9AGAM|nr:hypothetical protein F5148DRAFT_1213265 [Russula earlei]